MVFNVYDHVDPRSRDWAFVGTPLYPLVTCGCYLLFVYVIGPRYMKNRPALDLRWPMKVHNMFMVMANAYFFTQFSRHSVFAGYNLLCQGMTYSTDANSLRLLELGWWFLLVRTLDFLDTAFFILRKKFDHVSFHHVSHHFCCIFFGHLWLSLGMDGQSWFGICVNCGIHVLMHTYYFLAACGPKAKLHRWWKSHLTSAQIYQHYAIIAHGLIPLFYDCGYPRVLIFIALPQGVLGLMLFLNFYKTTYQSAESLMDVVPGALCVLTDHHDPLKLQKMLKHFDETEAPSRCLPLSNKKTG
ncbi:elongation of very long chain fatty acids protein 4-like [Tropilaelaps mercedesae]|uniref:Elongation of very long chain fatty acids protein n=1 Tax=Tropilaelaps mercedesae TaxID=418985 RepID=A0A1V9XRF6_9ACAR|nr:elongation of very long chain fatty acids protein 4-like [Tropilaelaps mercedesae]